jgi:hypothetical protein
MEQSSFREGNSLLSGQYFVCRDLQGPGPDRPVNVWVRAGFGPDSSDNHQMVRRTFRAFSVYPLFEKEKLFVFALILCS